MALTETDREDVRIGHAMERLVALPEWQELVQYVEERQAQDFYKRAIAPMTKADDAFGAEYAKGTLNGIQLTLGQPARIIALMREILQREEQETENGDRKPADRVSGHQHEPSADRRGGDSFAP